MTAYLDRIAARAYKIAARHWKTCPRCFDAGGERAEYPRLCAVGFRRLRAWEACIEIAAQRRAA